MMSFFFLFTAGINLWKSMNELGRAEADKAILVEE
jgi:hypothetical protein